jgi:PPP family 3-phenylpropionic acid transporter
LGGRGLLLGGAVEVPTFRLASRLMQRRGVRITFGLGCLVYAIGFVLWGIVTSPVLLSLLFPLEGVGFALLFASGVVIVGRLVPAQVHATGQAISGLTWMGLAPILGGPLGGWIFGTVGAVALYAGASALCLVGGTIVWRTLSGPAFSSPLDRRQVDEVAVPTSAEV